MGVLHKIVNKLSSGLLSNLLNSVKYGNNDMPVSESILYQLLTKHVSIYDLMQTRLYYISVRLKITISQQRLEVLSHTKF